MLPTYIAAIVRHMEEINPAEKKLIVIDAEKKRILRLIGIALLVISVFLFLRFVLEVFGANPQAPFVGLVYLVSGFFLLPFSGIFPGVGRNVLPGHAVIDVSALMAFFCYIVLALLATGIIQISANILKTGKKVEETVEHDNPVDDDSELVHKVAS